MAKVKLPNIYRYFTDNKVWVATACFLLAIVIGIKSFDLYKSIRQKQQLDATREKITSDMSFWQNIIKEHPDYRDAYFQLAVLEYKMQDIDKAKKNLQKVFELDPNYEAGRKLEKLLY